VKASRAKPKQEIARRALEKLYPAEEVPSAESNKRLIQRVVKQLKDDGQWPKDDSTRPVSAESILRAAKRK
jgi:hypothetical protein